MEGRTFATIFTVAFVAVICILSPVTSGKANSGRLTSLNDVDNSTVTPDETSTTADNKSTPNSSGNSSIPSSPTPSDNKTTSVPTTLPPTTSAPTTSTSTVAPPTTNGTTPITIPTLYPTTVTPSPTPNATTTLLPTTSAPTKPTVVPATTTSSPPTAAPSKDRRFDGPSFVGDDFYHFQHPEVPVREKRKADTHLEQISRDERASWVQQQLLRRRHKRSSAETCESELECAVLRPSDKIYDHAVAGDDLHFNDPFYPQQWYLQSRGLQSHGLNVVSAWKLGWTGRGVTISVLDDGLMYTNADISPNYDASVSCNLSNFEKKDLDPTPNMTSADNSHGTYCAAIMAAAENNSYCGVGVAYEARVGGVRLLEGSVTDMQEAAALVYGLDKVDVFSASWGPKDNGAKVDGPGKLAQAALRRGVTMGRSGKGVIYVWAVGNGGLRNDNCNLDGYASSIYTVSINALTESGLSCFYDEPCSSTLASTYVGGYHLMPDDLYSNEEKREVNSYVVVPELDGQCRDSFQGTSAAAPLAAGMIALMLQANPDLSWRDVQHILVHTARKPNDDTGWHTNAAGLHYHLLYGFGALDALSLVTTATRWHNMPEQAHFDGVATFLPVNTSGEDSSAVDIFVNMGPGYSMEHTVACVTLVHSERGRLELFLISPAGTISQLLTQRKYDNSTSGFNTWNFTSVHFWDESPHGTWQLLVTNNSNETAILKYFKLMLYVYKVDNT